MSFTVKRKQILFAGLAVSLAGAMFVNWYYTRPSANPTAEVQTTQQQQVNLGDAQFVNAQLNDDFFTTARLNRSKAQDESRQHLEEILKNSEIDEQSRQSAQKALEELESNIVKQTDIENFIKAKSGSEVLVSIGSTAEVILEKGSLTDELCLQIKDIITRKTELSSEKITIIEAK